MFNGNNPYPGYYYINLPMNCACQPFLYPQLYNTPMPYMNYNNPNFPPASKTAYIKLKDYGPDPFAINIEEASKQNNNFRTALWTGKHLQITLMSINPGEDIGLEIHPDLDQFIRIEQGQGIVKMGDKKDNLDFQANVYDDYAFVIPAGKWHNLINIGSIPIKLYSIYAPPQHPKSTIHETKADAEAAEEKHNLETNVQKNGVSNTPTQSFPKH